MSDDLGILQVKKIDTKAYFTLRWGEIEDLVRRTFAMEIQP
jgi:hypothetical protein